MLVHCGNKSVVSWMDVLERNPPNEVFIVESVTYFQFISLLVLSHQEIVTLRGRSLLQCIRSYFTFLHSLWCPQTERTHLLIFVALTHPSQLEASEPETFDVLRAPVAFFYSR